MSSQLKPPESALRKGTTVAAPTTRGAPQRRKIDREADGEITGEYRVLKVQKATTT
jgi:hypothetical protein